MEPERMAALSLRRRACPEPHESAAHFSHTDLRAEGEAEARAHYARMIG
jgi:hypothetical protein